MSETWKRGGKPPCDHRGPEQGLRAGLPRLFGNCEEVGVPAAPFLPYSLGTCIFPKHIKYLVGKSNIYHEMILNLDIGSLLLS